MPAITMTVSFDAAKILRSTLVAYLVSPAVDDLEWDAEETLWDLTMQLTRRIHAAHDRKS